MRRLIYFEGRKHFLTKPMLVLVSIFLLVNAIKIYAVYKEQSPLEALSDPCFKEAYDALYFRYKGELTEEKVDGIMDIYTPLREKVDAGTYSTEREEGCMTYNTRSDCLLLDWCFLSNIAYETEYKSYADAIVKNVVSNIEFYNRHNNGYEARKNYKIAKAFQNRTLSNFYNTDGFRSLMYYDFSTLIVLLLCLFGCSSVFTKEKETEMDLLLATSVKGKGATLLAKLIATILFLLFICVLFSTEDYLLFYWNFENMDAYLEPLYMLEAFKDTMLHANLITAYLITVASKMLGVCAIGMLFLMVSLYGKNALTVIVGNLGVLIGLIAAYGKFSKVSELANPFSLLYARKLFMYPEFINCFGMPIMDFVFVYIFAVVFMVVLILVLKRKWQKG